MSDKPTIRKTASHYVDEYAELKREITLLQAEVERLRGREDALWETFVKVADFLGIDCEEARKIPGKPSRVFQAAIIRKQAEAVDAVIKRIREARYEVDKTSAEESDTACTLRIAESIAISEAQRLRQQAAESEQ